MTRASHIVHAAMYSSPDGSWLVYHYRHFLLSPAIMMMPRQLHPTKSYKLTNTRPGGNGCIIFARMACDFFSITAWHPNYWVFLLIIALSSESSEESFDGQASQATGSSCYGFSEKLALVVALALAK